MILALVVLALIGLIPVVGAIIAWLLLSSGWGHGLTRPSVAGQRRGPDFAKKLEAAGHRSRTSKWRASEGVNGRERRTYENREPGSPPDRIDLEPLPRLARHRPGKELGVHDLGQDLEALDDARPRAVEVGGAVHRVDVS